jgi:hypothetical protein
VRPIRLADSVSRFPTPYVPHYFGEDVTKRLKSSRGWVTAGVASSIPWPPDDVCIVYGGEEYFLRGTKANDRQSPPCITVAAADRQIDEAMAKIYRLTSILGWFFDGYVDVGGAIWGSHPTLYGDPLRVYSALGAAGAKRFNCNHLPIVEQESVRIALAFWREGKRLSHVHAGYAFLSFYKAIESQFSDQRVKRSWIVQALDRLTDRAEERVQQLRASGIDVSEHLFASCRCAVAHASLGGVIVDPDISADRSRLELDLDVMEELATLYIAEEIGVPTAKSNYHDRNRLEPWNDVLDASIVEQLVSGGLVEADPGLLGRSFGVNLWPDGPLMGLERLTCERVDISAGVVTMFLLNASRTICLLFHLDFPNGRLHTDLERSGYFERPELTEEDVKAFATFFYNVLGNGIAEVTTQGCEPVDCEVVIPVNIIPGDPDKGVEAMVRHFRQQSGLNSPEAGGTRGAEKGRQT